MINEIKPESLINEWIKKQKFENDFGQYYFLF